MCNPGGYLGMDAPPSEFLTALPVQGAAGTPGATAGAIRPPRPAGRVRRQRPPSWAVTDSGSEPPDTGHGDDRAIPAGTSDASASEIDEGARLHLVPAGAYGSWDELYVDNVVRLYRLLYSKLGNRQDAEDLTSEVFLAALGPLRPTASRPEVRAYLAATSQSALARYWSRRLGAAATVIEVAAAVEFLNNAPTESDAPARLASVLAGLF